MAILPFAFCHFLFLLRSSFPQFFFPALPCWLYMAIPTGATGISIALRGQEAPSREVVDSRAPRSTFTLVHLETRWSPQFKGPTQITCKSNARWSYPRVAVLLSKRPMFSVLQHTGAIPGYTAWTTTAASTTPGVVTRAKLFVLHQGLCNMKPRDKIFAMRHLLGYFFSHRLC